MISTASFVRQELGNPYVMEHLRTMPEETGGLIAEFYQRPKWKNATHSLGLRTLELVPFSLFPSFFSSLSSLDF